MLKVRNLFSAISFEVGNGQILGVVGPNGSGKSELLQNIATPGLAENGEIIIQHCNSAEEPDKARQLLGYLPNPVALEPHLTGVEYLELIANFYDLAPKQRLKRILELAELLGCRQSLYTLVERLSLAERQKIGLVAALLHEAPLLLLDEPWLHLDWPSQKIVCELLLMLAKKGKSIVIASNDLGKVEIMADEIIFLEDGAVRARGTLEQLAKQTQTKSKSLLMVWENLMQSQPQGR